MQHGSLIGRRTVIAGSIALALCPAPSPHAAALDAKTRELIAALDDLIACMERIGRSTHAERLAFIANLKAAGSGGRTPEQEQTSWT